MSIKKITGLMLKNINIWTRLGSNDLEVAF